MPGVSKKSNKSNTLRRKPRAKKNTRRVTKKKGGMNISDLNVLPPDITRSIQGFVKPALTNTTIRVAVRGYLAGGKDSNSRSSCVPSDRILRMELIREMCYNCMIYIVYAVGAQREIWEETGVFFPVNQFTNSLFSLLLYIG